ncbi:MAG: methyltransferase domain-containing protein [Spirochaetes bacterium]|nr:MAG: methyltransferase domain-containing protein [Spirochaetota bacterium]
MSGNSTDTASIRIALTLDTGRGMESYHVYGERHSTEDVLHLSGHFNELEALYDAVNEGADFLEDFEERLWPYIWMEGADGYVLLDDFNVSVDFTHERSIGDMASYIYIDPRRAFGDGKHPTTVLCMKLLAGYLRPIPEEARKGLSIMDVGTGTGILSIFAARYGVRDIRGIDIHDRAVACARENMIANGCGFIDVGLGDLANFNPGRTYDIVLANIITDVILAYLDRILALVAPGGALIMSGILTRRAHEVLEALRHRGIRIADDAEMDGWTGLFIRMDG